MMKKALLSMALMLLSIGGYAQGITGKWITESGDAQVEIYQQGNVLNGKIVAVAQADGREHPLWPVEEEGQVGGRQDLQSEERQDLQVLHLARRQRAEGEGLLRHVLRDADLEAG